MRIAWFDRTPAGWALLAAIAALVCLHLFALSRVLVPDVDEAYRRTFVTREFAAYPTSAEFMDKGARRNALTYLPGTRVEVAGTTERLYLARFEWSRFDKKTPYLKGLSGRFYVHVPPDERRPSRAHRLDLQITCAMPEGGETVILVEVDGTAVGEVPCGRGTVTASLPVAAGLIGDADYDMVTLTRRHDTWWEPVATRIGLRYEAVALDWFRISRADDVAAP